MGLLEKISYICRPVADKLRPYMKAVGAFLSKVGNVVELVFRNIFKFRKIIAAVPVAVGAVYLALRNETTLSRVVGIGLQENGAFSYQILREVAVLVPLMITAMCLLLMFCSRRILTPWVVSLITLLIPIMIWITNVFPA